ncbi:hypothetical protein RYZ20_00045 [Thioclava sp. A2]|nr:hypothetical protein [Thioclava sp. A2]
MVGANNQILTVSYGTFSCTLEGFDQPFQTMQKIAEYFRDLAAEDRYFGAEPPTPDAEMLHQIAEREVKRRVEARLENNGLVLRAAEPEAQVAAPVAPPVMPPRAEPIAETPTPLGPETVAAKLQRIREAVATARAASARQTEYIEDQHAANTAFMAEQEPEPETAGFGYELDISGPLTEAELEDATLEDEGVEEAQPDEDEEAEAVASVMAALEEEAVAIQAPEAEAPVAEEEIIEPVTDEAAQEDDIPTESEAGDFAARDAIRDARRARRRAARRAALVDAARIAAEPEEPLILEAPVDEGADEAQVFAVADEMTDTPVSALDAEQSWLPEDEPAAGMDDLSAEPDLAESVEPALRARVIKVRRVAPASEVAEEPAQDDDAMIDALSTSLEADLVAEPVSAGALSPEDEEDLLRELAELEGQPEAGADDLRDLTGDAVAELALELDVADAEAVVEEPEVVEADYAPVVGDEPVLNETADDLEETYADLPLPETAVEEMEEEVSAAEREAEVSRLMREADTRVSAPETRRRVSAIAHLKAAVAATVADRLARGQDTAKGAGEEDNTQVYREDLSEAVRPRRPVAGAGRSAARPDAPPAPRPAPLVLVSEQRVDTPAETPLAPIRPRRVSAAQIMAEETEDAIETAPLSADEATSFAEFAESLGTEGLSDLLEAAAAYTAQIEGRPHFSPPQIMRKLQSLEDGADFTREDRLRVFGKLLRQGKITKVKRGQYAITEASRFYDQAKSA